MITKFERKVIAGLTAFLMCLSMVLAVPVSVNAEAEQTQDEAVSGAKQEETVSDVQMQDESRYVRIVAYGAGMNPPTHVRPEQTTKVCIDEIIIE